jgi:hypothetical protein
VKATRIKIASLKILIILFAFILVVIIIGCASKIGCASNLTGYYSKLRTKIDSGDYESVAKFVDKSQNKYGFKNTLTVLFRFRYCQPFCQRV